MTPLPETGGETNWGRVDMWDTGGLAYERYGTELCPPPTQKYAEQSDRSQGKRIDGSQSYVLCSQKAEKTVVICIAQVKDSPEMAKNIFETFRWTP